MAQQEQEQDQQQQKLVLVLFCFLSCCAFYNYLRYYFGVDSVSSLNGYKYGRGIEKKIEFIDNKRRSVCEPILKRLTD